MAGAAIARDESGELLLSRNGDMVRTGVPSGTTAEDLLAGVEFAPVLATQITLVAEDSPAQAAGLEPGDLVYTVNDTTISLDSTLSDVILENAGEEVRSISVARQRVGELASDTACGSAAGRRRRWV